MNDQAIEREKQDSEPTQPQFCPRAVEQGVAGGPFRPPFNGEMVWHEDGTCSYCGSLNGDILMERLEAGTIILTGTDKNYKAYVEAAEGSEPLSARKFYFQHLSVDQRKRFVDLWNERRIRHSIYVLPFFMRAEASPLQSA